MAKAWYTSKTVWVGIIEIAIGVLGIGAEFLNKGDYSPASFVVLGIGILTVVLRFMTTEAVM